MLYTRRLIILAQELLKLMKQKTKKFVNKI